MSKINAEVKGTKCIQCNTSAYKNYFKLNCNHFVCPNCIMKLLQLNKFRGVSKQKIFIICNCSTEKNSISLEKLDDLFYKEFGEVNLKNDSAKFDLLKTNFFQKLKNDYSVKKVLINDTIKELGEIAKIHKEKYEAFQSNSKQLFNLIKYIMVYNEKCDIENVLFSTKMKNEFQNLLNLAISIKNKKNDLNAVVKLNLNYDEFHEMKVKMYNDCYDIFKYSFPNSKSTTNLIDDIKDEGQIYIFDKILSDYKKSVTTIHNNVNSLQILNSKKHKINTDYLVINQGLLNILSQKSLNKNILYQTNKYFSIEGICLEKVPNKVELNIEKDNFEIYGIPKLLTKIEHFHIHSNNIEIIQNKKVTLQIESINLMTIQSKLNKSFSHMLFELQFNAFELISRIPLKKPGSLQIESNNFLLINSKRPINVTKLWEEKVLVIEQFSIYINNIDNNSSDHLINTSLSNRENNNSVLFFKELRTISSTFLQVVPVTQSKIQPELISVNNYSINYLPCETNKNLIIQFFNININSSPKPILKKEHIIQGTRTKSTKRKDDLPPNPNFPGPLKTTGRKETSTNLTHTKSLSKKMFSKEKNKKKGFKLLFVCKAKSFTIESIDILKHLSEDTIIRVSKPTRLTQVSSQSNSVEELNIHSKFERFETEPSKLKKIKSPEKKKNYEIKPPFELAKEIKSKVFSPDPLKKYSSFSGFKKNEEVKDINNEPKSPSNVKKTLNRNKEKKLDTTSGYRNTFGGFSKNPSRVSVNKSPSMFKCPKPQKINPNKSIRYSTTTKPFSKLEIGEKMLLSEPSVLEGIKYLALISEDEIAACSYNSEAISVYSTNDLDNVLYTLQGHTKEVNIVLQLVKSDIPTIVSGSNDSTILIWDLSTKTYSKKLVDGSKCQIVSIIEISKNLIASSSFWSIRFWDIEKGIEKFVLLGHSRDIINLINIADNIIASSSRDSSIKLWDIKKKEEIFTVYSSKSMCPIIQIDTGKFAFTSDDNKIILFNYKNKKEITSLKGHTDIILSIVLLKKNKLVSLGNDGVVFLWDLVDYTNLVITDFKGDKNKDSIITCVIENNILSNPSLNLEDNEETCFGTKNGTLIRLKLKEGI